MPQLDLNHLAEELRVSIGDFVRGMRAESRKRLSLPFLESLAHLDRNPGISTARLAELRGVRHQSMRQTVEDLLAAGYITREPSPQDGRTFLLQLTTPGLEVLLEDRHARAETIATHARAALNEDELEILSLMPDLLNKINKARSESTTSLP